MANEPAATSEDRAVYSTRRSSRRGVVGTLLDSNGAMADNFICRRSFAGRGWR